MNWIDNMIADAGSELNLAAEIIVENQEWFTSIEYSEAKTFLTQKKVDSIISRKGIILKPADDFNRHKIPNGLSCIAYSEKELSFIISNWDCLRLKDIAYILDRAESGIRAKARELNLPFRQYNKGHKQILPIRKSA